MAIEVVTLLGSSVVDVTYRSEPQRTSRARRVLAGVGLACLVSSAAAFGVSVVTAAENQAAFHEWTVVAKRPAYAFRPTQNSRLLDVLAFGGLALGVCAFTGMLLCRRPESDASVLAGEVVSYDELAALTGTIERGPATYLIRSVDAPEHESFQPHRAELRPLVFAAGSLAVHLGFLWLMSRTPIEGDPQALSFAPVEPLELHGEAVPVEERPVEEVVHAHDLDRRASMTLEYSYRDDRPTRHLTIQPHKEHDPQKARALAIEAARNAGVLGSTLLRHDFFSSLEGVEVGRGFDSTNIYGGIIGNEPAEYGSFGFGRSGFGICGGIHVGTIGHGHYSGFGRAIHGNYSLPHREHHGAVPTTSLGQATQSGDYDKSIIRRYIKRNLSKITYCYEKELLAKPTLAGTVTVQFLITPNGTVGSAVGHGGDENVSRCVANVIEAIEFPRPPSGGSVLVNYPFNTRLAGS